MSFKTTLESFVLEHLPAPTSTGVPRLFCAWMPFNKTSSVYLRIGSSKSNCVPHVLILANCSYTAEDKKSELQFIKEIIDDFEIVAQNNGLVPCAEYDADASWEDKNIIDFLSARGYKTIEDRPNWMAKTS
jgi:hypothetical protein